jgi:hypothetical protein
MNTVNPFREETPEDAAARRSAPTPFTDRDAIRLARQVIADANAGRSSYTMGMLVVMTIACAAILGVCGTTLQDLMTSQETRKGLIECIIAGGATGVVLGAIVAMFVRVSIQTIFLGSMTGGLMGCIATPSALYAEQSPTAALIAAAVAGPLFILGVSYVFARLSRRPVTRGQAPEPTSPWEPLPAAPAAPTRISRENPLEELVETEEESPAT